MLFSTKLTVEVNRCKFVDSFVGFLQSRFKTKYIIQECCWSCSGRFCFFFFIFTQGFEETGAYNMLAIMLLPRCKGMQCILKFVGPVQEKAVVVEYDQKVLMPMLHKA
jgi:hypothetical protein